MIRTCNWGGRGTAAGHGIPIGIKRIDGVVLNRKGVRIWEIARGGCRNLGADIAALVNLVWF